MKQILSLPLLIAASLAMVLAVPLPMRGEQGQSSSGSHSYEFVLDPSNPDRSQINQIHTKIRQYFGVNSEGAASYMHWGLNHISPKTYNDLFSQDENVWKAACEKLFEVGSIVKRSQGEANRAAEAAREAAENNH